MNDHRWHSHSLLLFLSLTSAHLFTFSSPFIQLHYRKHTRESVVIPNYAKMLKNKYIYITRCQIKALLPKIFNYMYIAFLYKIIAFLYKIIAFLYKIIAFLYKIIAFLYKIILNCHLHRKNPSFTINNLKNVTLNQAHIFNEYRSSFPGISLTYMYLHIKI